MLRFGVVGLINTALGYAVILTGLALGWGDIVSNAAGYAAGLLAGFTLNRRWTFGSQAGPSMSEGRRYVLVFLAAYCANLAVLALARSLGFVESPLAQLAGLCTYSILFYLGSSRYVFVSRPGLRAQLPPDARVRKP
ncbi:MULTISPECIES: GtrA family protein [unclassified Bosea (in: a-proteobacteria)]|uniref:GtrA family protein n=1 Tax=unclassified Bosea (in: a-proteobacteria) TaxID=2653178 RepID=UPI001F18A20D|nr:MULTISPECIES: GtrA family protein [unclassified Bosea (in: a-proteobacteria)]